ncbi:hypothetical protein B0O99DRAFT_155197 [Bisporella sp. PMI_857]|nr:hypothetical protein B0O99DRAFT_155197 [Bisporella sp. PMI_857]
MNSETLLVKQLPSKIQTNEHAGPRKRDLPKSLPIWRENASNHRAISNSIRRQDSISTSDGVATSKFSPFRAFAPNVPTTHCLATSSEGTGTRGDHPRPLSGVCLSALQNPPRTVTACAIEQRSQPLSQDYADPKRVPGTDQNIYARAPISLEFHERYPQLVDFFKQAVDSHKFLKQHTSKINYELRLCGSTPSNAVPSIIIFCAEAIFKHLRSLLNSRHIRRQYQLEKPFALKKFPFATSNPHPQASAPVIVPFKIIFWREVITPTERKSAIEQVVAQNDSFLTMCGSLVRYGDRTSTLALIISVDSKLYGLTVDHLFRSQRDEEQSMITMEPNISCDESDIEGDQAECPWLDDVTYEDLDNDQRVSDNGSVAPGRSHAEVTLDMGHALTEHGTSINGHKLDSLHGTGSLAPYLDWALIEFDNGYFERPNAFYSEEDPAYPKFLAKLSATPQTNLVPVFMISGASGTRRGLMLNHNSYIGGKPGENLCQAWNVLSMATVAR